MEAKAVAKHVRISARKARLVADEVRGYDYKEAIDILRFTNKAASSMIINLLNSAVANAIQMNESLDPSSLYVKKIYVDDGPIMKRFRPRARGRASRIRKRLSHITVVVSEIEKKVS
ncbi:50S ribosomal protein L22 [Leptospira vanthielii]|uniref:Large ribosomal subunit protein uL22 n=2 Tax=Leptospira vanthielii TaxID=293085 RepID=A0ABY2NL54_9LEPT|nr:50S ribosomal protein L22 [Leptospira vanthielii]EMY69659.1 ribosomal protein L22 [Leptospira vanthielii serovar Holland str. Waz Holland = ATCC 700522]TGM51381.1 50S ribosomal protein L22 [Leptospira vanthielii]